jgi:hypothetical protein
MQLVADTFGSGAARGAGASADAASGTDWGKVIQEMQAVDAEWALSKGGRAREWQHVLRAVLRCAVWCALRLGEPSLVFCC